MSEIGPITVLVLAAGIVAALVAAVVLLVRQRSPATEPPSGTSIPAPAGRPRIYLALDVETIFDLYEQTDDATVQVSTTRTRTAAVRLGADTSALNVGVERADDGQIHTEHLPVKEASRAVAVVERRLELDEPIPTFDLKASTDDGPLTTLLDNLHSGAARIGLGVPDEVEASLRRAWEQRSRLVTDTTLRSLGPYVRLRAEFEVSIDPTRGDRVLACPWQDHSVRVVCPRSHVRPLLVNGPRKITATCLGTPDWDGDGRLLRLQPISVHLS